MAMEHADSGRFRHGDTAADHGDLFLYDRGKQWVGLFIKQLGIDGAGHKAPEDTC